MFFFKQKKTSIFHRICNAAGKENEASEDIFDEVKKGPIALKLGIDAERTVTHDHSCCCSSFWSVFIDFNEGTLYDMGYLKPESFSDAWKFTKEQIKPSAKVGNTFSSFESSKILFSGTIFTGTCCFAC